MLVINLSIEIYKNISIINTINVSKPTKSRAVEMSKKVRKKSEKIEHWAKKF